LFSRTNNAQFDILQAVCSGLIFVVCFIPRLSNKHYAMLTTLIGFLLLTVAAMAASAVLIIK
jgi:hypothetical protein